MLNIIICLDSSKSDIPRPPREELKLIVVNNLQKIGYSSYNALYKKSKSCRVEVVEDGYRIVPYEYYVKGKPSKGLKPLNKNSILIKEKENLVSNIKSILNKDFS
jgi:hypothetical protein